MLLIESTSKENTINYPDHVSEFEVQAYLYWMLKQSTAADIRAEVKSRGTHGLRPSKTACRFDIVVFKNAVAVCIVEVKSDKVRHSTTMQDTRQGTRYPTYGVPVVVCYGMNDIPIVISTVQSILG